MIVKPHFRTVARAGLASATVMLMLSSCVEPETPEPETVTETTTETETDTTTETSTVTDTPDPTTPSSSGSGSGTNSAIPTGFTGPPGSQPTPMPDKRISHCAGSGGEPGTTYFTDGTTGWTTYCAERS